MKTKRRPFFEGGLEDWLTVRPWWPKIVLTIFLLASPIGGVWQWIVVHWLGYCNGAMGGGVTCQMGAFSNYFVAISVIVEIGILGLFSFVWAAMSVGLFGCLLLLFYLSLRDLFQKPKIF